MKRIDFIGPPGAGKTTILNGLIRRREGSSWLTAEEARQEVLYHSFRKNRYSLKDYLKIIGSPLMYGKRYVPVDDVGYSQFIIGKTESYKELIRTAFTSLRDDDETASYLKIKRLSWLMRTVEDVVLMEEGVLTADCVLFDESLMNRIFSYVLDKEEIDKKSFETLLKPTLPAGFICLTADEETLISRLKKRERTTLAHRAAGPKLLERTTKSALIKTEYAVQTLQSLGCRGLKLNASLPAHVNVEAIRQFLLQLEKEQVVPSKPA